MFGVMLGTGEAFEVFEPVVGWVLVFVVDLAPFGDRPVRSLPNPSTFELL
jgi:hypothetical protein